MRAGFGKAPCDLAFRLRSSTPVALAERKSSCGLHQKSGEFSLEPPGLEVADKRERLTGPETVEHRQDRRLPFGRRESPHITGRAL